MLGGSRRDLHLKGKGKGSPLLRPLEGALISSERGLTRLNSEKKQSGGGDPPGYGG